MRERMWAALLPSEAAAVRRVAESHGLATQFLMAWLVRYALRRLAADGGRMDMESGRVLESEELSIF